MTLKFMTTSLLICQLALMAITTSTLTNASEHDNEANVEEVEKGPNYGRMLRDGDFALELALFETGVPPEFRVFITKAGKNVDPSQVKLNIQLNRLGNVIDNINFTAQDGFLRGDLVIYEPHSFEVVIKANYQGKQYQWRYDNFEGRSQIPAKMANDMNIVTDFVSSRTFNETLNVYGRLSYPPQAIRHVSARFPGEIKAMAVSLGQRVKKGQWLMTVQSNESLQSYKIYSPINGVITQQDAGIGEQTGGNSLLTITDTGELIAELAVYPMDGNKVKLGAPVSLMIAGADNPIDSEIVDSLTQVNKQQARIYRAKVANPHGIFAAGQFVEAQILIGRYPVEKAVNVAGLQSFRDFTVVYTKVGDIYEVRMLELGRTDGDWVEVLSGIKSGAEYVSENSYIIKADIDKAGASHDH